MLEQMRLEEEERRKAAREGRRMDSTSVQGSDEGYLAYMSRQVQERTERLNLMGDTMDRLEENSSGFANDVNKYVQSQKRKMFLGGKSSQIPGNSYIYMYSRILTPWKALGSKFGL